LVALDEKALNADFAYLGALDGLGREDLFYGYHDDNEATPANVRKAIFPYLDLAEAQGVPVLVTDYCWTQSRIDDSYAQNAARAYISFAADRRDLDAIPAYPAAPYQQNTHAVEILAVARNFGYFLDADAFGARAAYLDTLAQTNYDVLIIDLFHGDTALTAQELAQIHTKPIGGARLILAYMSIGEAEEYRYYWQAGWKPGSPPWLLGENPEWGGNYKVAYWDPAWQAIIFGSANAYLDRILNAGFDGVYLDIIDAYEYFEDLPA